VECRRHPGHEAWEKCRRCGKHFCVMCIVETDQAELCPDCLFGIEKEMEGAGEKSPSHAPIPTPGEIVGEDFLSLGPDEDFSFLKGEEEAKPGRLLGRGRLRWKPRRPAISDRELRDTGEGRGAAVEDSLPSSIPAVLPGPLDSTPKKAVAAPASTHERKGTSTDPSGSSAPDIDSRVLEEVISAVLGEEQQVEGAIAGEEEGAEFPPRAERLTRVFDLLAQPRVNQPTVLADSWWKSLSLAVALVLAVALCWALPNAYLIPRDTEYGLHSLLLGLAVGMVLWRKAGRKHGTRLALQALLITIVGLSLGEALHWFLVIVKNKALRTIVFDLITLRFLWENAGQVMRHVVEAMFPLPFLWILVLPSLLAFLVGFGMPPIPEIFFQLGKALRSGESRRA